jgi:hypothetical protein
VIYYRSTTLEKEVIWLALKIGYISRLFNYDEKYFYSLSLLILLISCSSPTPYGKPEVDPIEIQKNFMDWWTYL